MNNSKIWVIIFGIVMVVVAIIAFILTRGSNEPITPVEESNLNVSTKELTINRGETSQFYITLKNAVGRIDVTSSNESIASVSEDKVWLESISNDIEDQKVITVTGLETGYTSIIVNMKDVASFDSEQELTGSMVINVTVK